MVTTYAIDEAAQPQHWRRWTAHPRFPCQTLLLDSHAYFRRFCGWLLEQLDKLGTEVRGAPRRRRILRKLGDRYEDLLSSLRRHERYEERELYPFLERQCGVTFHDMVGDHRELGRLSARCERAFAAARWAERDDEIEAARCQARAALRAYHDTLLGHLDEEEQKIIPLLLELPPAAFTAFAGPDRRSCSAASAHPGQ